MIAKKEIIVLNGGGHKGIVKISRLTGRQGYIKINCSLDFRPNGAKLYLIGNNIAQTVLNDTNCDVEVPFDASDEIGCVLRSSSVTMFGGSGSKSEMLKKIDAFNRETTVKASACEAPEATAKQKKEVISDEADADGSLQSTSSQSNAKVQKSVSPDEPDSDDSLQSTSSRSNAKVQKSVNPDEPDSDDSLQNRISQRKEKAFVGVASKAEASVFSEWTKYDGNNFYYAVKPQIDEMFICYPSDDLLTATVPNSKWVRVDAEDGYYVVGLLFDGDDPSFICYGVPQADEGGQAPAELENTCVWLPVASDDIAGYWMIYQSAKTGEIIK